jgi:hypothetical protein
LIEASVPPPSPFDLFDYAYQRVVNGYDWTKKPPVV